MKSTFKIGMSALLAAAALAMTGCAVTRGQRPSAPISTTPPSPRRSRRAWSMTSPWMRQRSASRR